MPNYDYRCRGCGSEVEAFNRIAECNTNAPICCGERMPIIIKKAPLGFVDRPVEYICPVTGAEVQTRRQRNEIMAREGLVDANDLVNHKTIEARREKHEKMKEIAEAHRAPKVIEEYAKGAVKEDLTRDSREVVYL